MELELVLLLLPVSNDQTLDGDTRFVDVNTLAIPAVSAPSSNPAVGTVALAPKIEAPLDIDVKPQHISPDAVGSDFRRIERFEHILLTSQNNLQTELQTQYEGLAQAVGAATAAAQAAVQAVEFPL